MIFVSVCMFKRVRSSEYEYGIAIGKDESDIQTIVDRTGSVVKAIYDYNCLPTQGCFHTELAELGVKS